MFTSKRVYTGFSEEDLENLKNHKDSLKKYILAEGGYCYNNAEEFLHDTHDYHELDKVLKAVLGFGLPEDLDPFGEDSDFIDTVIEEIEEIVGDLTEGLISIDELLYIKSYVGKEFDTIEYIENVIQNWNDIETIYKEFAKANKRVFFEWLKKNENWLNINK